MVSEVRFGQDRQRTCPLETAPGTQPPLHYACVSFHLDSCFGWILRFPFPRFSVARFSSSMSRRCPSWTFLQVRQPARAGSSTRPFLRVFPPLSTTTSPRSTSMGIVRITCTIVRPFGFETEATVDARQLIVILEVLLSSAQGDPRDTRGGEERTRWPRGRRGKATETIRTVRLRGVRFANRRIRAKWRHDVLRPTNGNHVHRGMRMHGRLGPTEAWWWIVD